MTETDSWIPGYDRIVDGEDGLSLDLNPRDLKEEKEEEEWVKQVVVVVEGYVVCDM